MREESQRLPNRNRCHSPCLCERKARCMPRWPSPAWPRSWKKLPPRNGKPKRHWPLSRRRATHRTPPLPQRKSPIRAMGKTRSCCRWAPRPRGHTAAAGDIRFHSRAQFPGNRRGQGGICRVAPRPEGSPDRTTDTGIAGRADIVVAGWNLHGRPAPGHGPPGSVASLCRRGTRPRSRGVGWYPRPVIAGAYSCPHEARSHFSRCRSSLPGGFSTG